jgi:hypothetical protein
MLFWYEFKKLLLAPAVIGFVLLSIAANIAMILTYNNSVSDFDSKPYDVFAEFKTSKLAEMYITQYSMPEDDAARIRLKYEQLKTVLDEKSQMVMPSVHIFVTILTTSTGCCSAT